MKTKLDNLLLSRYDRVILASKSPRRLDILRNHGVEPIVKPGNADESLPEGYIFYRCGNDAFRAKKLWQH